MARKRKKTITMRRRKSGVYTAPKRRSSSRSSSGMKGIFGSEWGQVAMAGILYGIISRVIRAVLAASPSLNALGNLGLPLLVLFVNTRFFGNSYINVLALNDLTQGFLRQNIPGLAVTPTGQDSLDAPYSVGKDSLDAPFSVGEDDLGEDDLGEDDLGEDDLGEDDLGEDSELAGIVGMTSPKDFQI